MNKNEKKIIDNIVKVNINFNSVNLGLLNEASYTFILVDKAIKYGTQTLAEKAKSELSVKTPDKERVTVDSHCLKVYKTTDLNQISVDGDDTFSEELRKTIETYWLEGGNNLHIIDLVDENYVLPEDFNYTVGIYLSKNTLNSTALINKVIKGNLDRDIFWILPNKPSGNNPVNTNRTFYLECDTKKWWLAFPAAYLNNLSLNNPVKDFCYTKSKSIHPDVVNNMSIDPHKQRWDKNYIVNIAGNGIALGGELYNGDNLVNVYMLMLLNKKLKVVIFNELINKPSKSQVTGRLQNAITSELNNFYRIGAINSEIYNNINYTITYNNETYVVAESGELIENGYKLHIVDILKASKEDSDNRKMTPITILLMFQKQIRFVELNVEVL